MAAAALPSPVASERDSGGSPRAALNRRRAWTWSIVGALLTATLVGAVAWAFWRVPLEGNLTVRRYEASKLEASLLPPWWWSHTAEERQRVEALASVSGFVPGTFFGTDRLGRDVLARTVAGGAISLLIGLAAAALTVLIGTVWGVVAGVTGGRTDALLMRTVDILYGLPTILLVVLLAIGADGLWQHLDLDLSPGARQRTNLVVLMIAIGGVSWLTLARVIRGEVLSLRERPFMEACRAAAIPWWRQLVRHLLPNLMGPIVVYAALAVPAAILSESFLSFLGIGVQPPVPSWGNLAADGLSELNLVRSRWWLLLWPSLFIALTLVALNIAGDRLRRSLDPMRRAPRRARH
ncbi:MAG: ABC transporter permease [Phycisphaeraceae bacterium]|nr:ABC transporter permease [Phycisphaeraceae bacterium]